MLKGSIVALITPFKNDSLDEDTYRKLIDYHLKNGTNGVVLVAPQESHPLYLIVNIKKLFKLPLKSAKVKYL